MLGLGVFGRCLPTRLFLRHDPDEWYDIVTEVRILLQFLKKKIVLSELNYLIS